MIPLVPLLAQAENTIQLLSGIENIGKLGVAVLAVLVALGVLLIAWSNSRSSNKIAAAMLATFGDSLKRTDSLHTRIENSERLAQERHEEMVQVRTEFTHVQKESIAVLKQLVTAVGTMKDEVVSMRNDNSGMKDLRGQIEALQKMVENQARQLEEQALEISTLRESNSALINTLETERKARTEAEIKLSKERDIARENEERNALAVRLLKDQFNALQAEFDRYKAKMNDKANKEATLKDELPSHPASAEDE